MSLGFLFQVFSFKNRTEMVLYWDIVLANEFFRSVRG